MLPPDCILRPAVPADIEAVTALLVATDVAEYGEPDWSLADQEQEWADPRLSLADDTRVVLDASGAVVGYGYVSARTPGGDYDGDVYADPGRDADGIEEELLAWAAARVAEQVAPATAGARLVVGTHAANQERAARLRAAGFTPLRHYVRMTIELPAGTAGEDPPGVVVRRCGLPEELRVVHEVLTEAFRGHFRSVAGPYDDWQAQFTARPDDGAPLLVAEVDGAVAGALTSNVTTPELGFIRQVGVLPGARGRGVGRALLLRAFAEFTALGTRRVSLGVDTANATGALALYERAGMRVERRYDAYAKLLAG